MCEQLLPGGQIRPATLDDVTAIELLIAQSVRSLQAGDYTTEQMDGALGTVFGVDRQLIRDGTYFVFQSADSIVGCGGWSRRKTLFGSDDVPGKDDSFLDPAVDPARIRAFFVHPDFARRGIGSAIMRTCEAAAVQAGFTRLELGATLTGVPLYQRHGFEITEPFEITLRNGVLMPLMRMRKPLGASACSAP